MNSQAYLNHVQICEKPRQISELTEAEKLDIAICPVCNVQKDTAKNLLFHIFSEHQVIPKEVSAKKQIEIIEIEDDDKEEEVIIEPIEAENNNETEENKECEIPDLDEQAESTKTTKTVSQISVRKDLYSTPKQLSKINGPMKYTCDLCNHTANSIQAMSIHKKFRHGTPLLHQCEACKKTFESNDQKIAHMEDAHGGIDRTHSCGYCNKAFANAKHLRVHVRDRHQQKLGPHNFKCGICQGRFESRRSLNRHQSTRHSIFFQRK